MLRLPYLCCVLVVGLREFQCSMVQKEVVRECVTTITRLLAYVSELVLLADYF